MSKTVNIVAEVMEDATNEELKEDLELNTESILEVKDILEIA